MSQPLVIDNKGLVSTTLIKFMNKAMAGYPNKQEILADFYQRLSILNQQASCELIRTTPPAVAGARQPSLLRAGAWLCLPFSRLSNHRDGALTGVDLGASLPRLFVRFVTGPVAGGCVLGRA